MCARIDQRPNVSPKQWQKAFSLPFPKDFNPERSIYPLEPILGLRIDPRTNTKALEVFSWGLLPVWAKEKKFGRMTYNARSESITEKPSFKNAFKKRRCIIGAESFFEWNEKKELYKISRKEGLFTFAGLWEWHEGFQTLSATVITSEPNKMVAKIGHDRTPVILEPGQFDAWLDPNLNETEILRNFLEPYQGKDLVIEKQEKKAKPSKSKNHV